MTRPLIYVAGPITSDPWGCAPKAVEWARELRDAFDFQSVLPQLSIFAEMHDHRDYEEYITDGLNLLSRCDGLLRIGGRSPGADREVAWAENRGIPVAYASETNLLGWAYQVNERWCVQ